ncbi:MAG: putative 7-carboxy-7-deazaguanine synthase QueE [Clostridia bacterium]|jgi:7-carboxy-7-deazaguanine synthase|nr:putative 7-carboxy-7-deazaguanine synthase QueE [Clostridia bacterium]
MLKVNEKFVSINGEGPHSGMLAVFIRFAGCNLQCSYCDTQYAANLTTAEHKEESVEDIMSYIEEQGIINVVLTGGEPLLQQQSELLRLIENLSARGYKVDIETNGSIDILPYRDIACIIMDYKLPMSGMEEWMCIENLQHLKNSDVVKFVCSTEKDLNRAYELIQEHDLTKKVKVFLSPVFGMIDPLAIVEYMKQKKLNNVTLQLQLHKILWDPQVRGV